MPSRDTNILPTSAQATSPMKNSNTAPRVEVAQHPGQLSPDAVALLDRSERRNIECGAKWFALLAKHLFPENGCWLLLHQDGRCQAVWPVQSGRPAGAMSSYYSALYSPSHSEDVSKLGLVQLARTLRKGRLKSGVHYFSPMDSESTEFEAMELALRHGGFVTRRYFRFVNWYLPCRDLTWAQYFGDRKGALRNTVRRMGKAPSRPTASPGKTVRENKILPPASRTSTHEDSEVLSCNMLAMAGAELCACAEGVV